MGINLQKLDAKLEKLKRLREMLADPDTAGILEEVLSTNGNGSEAQSHQERLTAVFHATPMAPASGMRGSLLHTAMAAARVMKQNFTSRHFHDQMEAMGYKFQAKDHMVAVGGVLSKLEEMGLVEKVEQGMGRRPNVYKSTGK
jgi:hypothetical protein